MSTAQNGSKYSATVFFDRADGYVMECADYAEDMLAQALLDDQMVGDVETLRFSLAKSRATGESLEATIWCEPYRGETIGFRTPFSWFADLLGR